MNTTLDARRTIWTVCDSTEADEGWQLEHEHGTDELTLVQLGVQPTEPDELTPEMVYNEFRVPNSLLWELQNAFSEAALRSLTEEWVETDWMIELDSEYQLWSPPGERLVTLEDSGNGSTMEFHDPWVFDRFLPYLEQAYTTLCK